MGDEEQLRIQFLIDHRSWSPDKVETVHEYGSHFLLGITRAFLAAYDTNKGVSHQRMGRAFTEIMYEGM